MIYLTLGYASTISTTITISGPSCPNNNIGAPRFTYTYDFGDGYTETVTSSSTTDEVNHTFAMPGNYTVTVTVTDAYGVSDTSTTEIDASVEISSSTHIFDNQNMTGDGTMSINGGTVEFHGNSQVKKLSFSGGTITGSGTLTVTGNMEWSGGTMEGIGVTNIDPIGTLTLKGSRKYLNRVLNNSGTTIWIETGGLTYSQANNNPQFNNLTGGTFDIQSNDTFSVPFTNNGTVVKSAGTGITRFDYEFVNTGVLEVKTGTLQLAGGLTNSGTINIATGATLQITGGNADNNVGGTITGTGTFDFNAVILNNQGTIDSSLTTSGVIPEYRITTYITPEGAGAVLANPSASSYSSGKIVELTAMPVSSCYRFTGWSGDCSGIDTTCEVTMAADKWITADFVLHQPSCASAADCGDAGGYWCNDGCKEEQCSIAVICDSTNLNQCTSETACQTEGGGYWCNDGCQDTPCPIITECSATTLTKCTNETACQTEGGGYWCNNRCQQADCPVVSNDDCPVATLSSPDLGIYIPILVYGEGPGEMRLWANLEYVQVDDKLRFEVSTFDYTKESPLSPSCKITTLSDELQLSIPQIHYQTLFGSQYFWAELIYVPQEDSKVVFELDTYGLIEEDNLDTDNDGDGYSENQGDCNDNYSQTYPGAYEVLNDGVDQDCNPGIFD